MKLDRSSQGLVMNLGVSDGVDTAYYLANGFQVFAVEADPEACRRLRLRFEAEIKSGALLLLNFAASDSFGETIEFFVHGEHQGISGMTKRPSLEVGYARHSVMTVDWPTLKAQAGLAVAAADFTGASGPFGLDVFGAGDWIDFAAVTREWASIEPNMSYTWYDCHAWKPN